MLELAQKGYSTDDVRRALHAAGGVRRVSFRYDLLNKRDIKIGELSTAKGSVYYNSLAEINRTAAFTLNENEFKDMDFLNDRIQPYFILEMPNAKLEWPLGIFLISSPRRTEQYGTVKREMEAYDNSVALTEDRFTGRYFIPKGTNYVNAAIEIINSTGIGKVSITANNAALSTDREFEMGYKKSQAVNDLLSAINYTSFHLDELGYVTARPYSLPTERPVDYAYKTDEVSIIHSGASEEIDLFNVPNIFVVVSTNPEIETAFVSVYTNDNAGSILSTVNRGRNIVDYRELTDIADQKTLDEYVQRVAYESSQVYDKVVFETAIMPHHSYGDALYIEHKDLKTAGKYIETSWEMKLEAGERMRHGARRVIKL